MAEYLRKIAKKATIRPDFFLFAIVAFAPNVFAEALPDPTRPPASVAPANQGNAVASEATPELQSIILATNRKIAIISGQTVRVGEKYGDARVIKITETEVVLRDGNELRTLKLFPSVEKRTAARDAVAKPDNVRQ